MGSKRDPAFHAYLVTVHRDFGDQRSVRSRRRVGDFAQLTDWNRTDDDVLVARLFRISAHSRKHPVEPDETATEHRMVARIVAVPLLPRGCRTLLKPPSEAREVLLVKERPSDIVHSVQGKRLIKEAVSDESHIDMAVVLDHQLVAECGAHILKSLAGNTHVQGIDIGAEIPVAFCLRIVEPFVEGVTDPLGLGGIGGGSRLVSKHLGRFRCDVGAQPIEECVDEFVLRQAECRSPVAEVVPVERRALRRRLVEGRGAVLCPPGVVVAHEILHRLEAVGEKRLVTVAVVELPRHDTDGGSPGRASSTAWLPRSAVRNIA